MRLGFLVLVYTVFWGSAAGGRLFDALGNVDQTNLQLISNTLSGTANFFVWTLTDNYLINYLIAKVRRVYTTVKTQETGAAHYETWNRYAIGSDMDEISERRRFPKNFR